eukprot:Blabericola_migrator_1__7996@NODE_40_length_17295_cov_124_751393_g36_i0_p4_GENE_NODE_40_length_17295_cov_124_751393_g36_i0NODE_40_length_17295_cov_124_751393_g36_i0_p4_ORF_typecomplete_len469_score58_40PIN_6/PF17146_4/6_4e19NOB1_Zn_bind/PF08772_11/3_2e17_NODE_40_length_17295_cov_124_751393_g36_i080429448
MSSWVVVDTNALVRHVSLFDPKKVYITLPCIINEVRDRQGREHLKNVSDFLRVEEPAGGDITYVKEIAKLTGDLPRLSIQDIAVLAVAVKHQKAQGLLLRDLAAVKALLAKPSIKSIPIGRRTKATECVTVPTRTAKHLAPSQSIQQGAGFEPSELHAESQLMQQVAELSLSKVEVARVSDEASAGTRTNEIEGFGPLDTTSREHVDLSTKSSAVDTPIEPELIASTGEEFSSKIEETYPDVHVTEIPTRYDVDDGEGIWITGDNFGATIDLNVRTEEVESPPVVACMTEDFAMQNILLVVGIPILTHTGKKIRSIRRWAYICSACRTLCHDMGIQFCKACGYASLRRVPVILKNDGTEKILLRESKPSLRGTIFKVPTILGGKYADKSLLLTPDMIMMGGRDREQRHRENQRERMVAQCSWDNWTQNDSLGMVGDRTLFKDFQVEYGKGNRNSARYHKLHNTRKKKH